MEVLRKSSYYTDIPQTKTITFFNLMARANRHHLPGYVWHITHRCHKKEFLFKFEKDKLNMVRAGVVRHPSEWALGGYTEIQNPKQRDSIINRGELANLLGIKDDVRMIMDGLGFAAS